jgi:hypothetical protein
MTKIRCGIHYALWSVAICRLVSNKDVAATGMQPGHEAQCKDIATVKQIHSTGVGTPCGFAFFLHRCAQQEAIIAAFGRSSCISTGMTCCSRV